VQTPKDPHELKDKGSEEEYSAVVAELTKSLLAWIKEVEDPLLEGPLRTPYYDRAMADLTSVGKEG
jgi:hypothetical protein